MRDLDSGDLQRYVDITSDFGTRAADSDDMGGRVLKRVDRKARRQEIIEPGAHHRKRRASVDKRIANLHFVDHGFREQLRRDSTRGQHGVTRLLLRFCTLYWLLATARQTVSTEMSKTTTRVTSARRFSFSSTRRRDVASIATLKTDCRIRCRARSIRLRRLRSSHNVF